MDTEPTRYACSACELAVLVRDEQVIRACSCDAPIDAFVSATVKAHGGMAQSVAADEET